MRELHTREGLQSRTVVSANDHRVCACAVFFEEFGVFFSCCNLHEILNTRFLELRYNVRIIKNGRGALPVLFLVLEYFLGAFTGILGCIGIAEENRKGPLAARCFTLCCIY